MDRTERVEVKGGDLAARFPGPPCTQRCAAGDHVMDDVEQEILLRVFTMMNPALVTAVLFEAQPGIVQQIREQAAGGLRIDRFEGPLSVTMGGPTRTIEIERDATGMIVGARTREA